MNRTSAKRGRTIFLIYRTKKIDRGQRGEGVNFRPKIKDVVYGRLLTRSQRRHWNIISEWIRTFEIFFFNCEVLRGIGKYCEVMQSIARYYKVLQSIGRFDGVLYGIARYLRYCKVLPLSPPPPRARLWLQYLGRKLQHDYWYVIIEKREWALHIFLFCKSQFCTRKKRNIITWF